MNEPKPSGDTGWTLHPHGWAESPNGIIKVVAPNDAGDIDIRVGERGGGTVRISSVPLAVIDALRTPDPDDGWTRTADAMPTEGKRVWFVVNGSATWGWDTDRSWWDADNGKWYKPDQVTHWRPFRSAFPAPPRVKP